MKKKEIYVVIDSEEKRLRAIQILTYNRERIYVMSDLNEEFEEFEEERLLFFDGLEWLFDCDKIGKTEITLDQLEHLLNPNFVVKEVVLSIDELQKQAESLGFELVKKGRQIKVGDFGKFWDSKDCIVYGFLESISEAETKFIYKRKSGGLYINFAHLTDEEKQQIQENW